MINKEKIGHRKCLNCGNEYRSYLVRSRCPICRKSNNYYEQEREKLKIKKTCQTCNTQISTVKLYQASYLHGLNKGHFCPECKEKAEIELNEIFKRTEDNKIELIELEE